MDHLVVRHDTTSGFGKRLAVRPRRPTRHDLSWDDVRPLARRARQARLEV